MGLNLSGVRYLINIFRPRNRQSPHAPQLRRLMQRIQYHFNNQELLEQALKHRSYLVLSGEDRLHSNERLELLGDAVLGMVITEYLYQNFPEAEEGVLTNYKSLLVNRGNLSRMGREFDLGLFLFLNDSEERAGGRQRDSILSDAVEALIGAIYLDGGIEPARKMIQRFIAPGLKALLNETQSRNYKSMLLEHCQKENIRGPIYVVEDEEGPDHCKTFKVAVLLNDVKYGIGTGPSKKLAEQKAAEESLSQLQIDNTRGRQI